MSIVLYEHNQKAYESAVSLMNETGKAAIIHPTGTGKSFIGFKLAEQHPDMRICWLSPSEYIFRTQLENLGQETEFANIKFLTYAKLMMSDESFVDEIKPDYIILDEFHRCGAVEWGKGVERLLATYPNAKKIGLSATNIRYLDNRRDMADELFAGNVASEMTLGEAIVRDILLPPTYVLSVYTYQKELKRLQQKADSAKNIMVRERCNKVFEKLRRAVAEADGLDIVFKKHIKDKAGKYLVFCSSVEHMNEISKSITKWFREVDSEPHIYKVYADESASVKEFAAFKSDNSSHLKLLLCVDMLNEGVHVEDIAGVIMFRPTVSPIIYKQQLGRALSASKTRVPIVFDIVNNFDGLYSIDSIESEMTTAIDYFRSTGWEKYIINERFTIIDEVRECRELFEAFNRTLDATWDAYFDAASIFYKENGHLDIPTTFKYKNLMLGKWIYAQRRIRKGEVSGSLTHEQIQRLESIKMIWNHRSDMPWIIGLEHALEFKKAFGHFVIPVEYVCPDGYKLGRWITSLRQIKSNSSRRGQLSDEKIRQLNELGMVWNTFDLSFEQKYIEAELYYKEHCDLLVPVDYVSSTGCKLGRWIHSMKSAKRGNNKALLDENRIARLDSIGMIWDNVADLQWEKGFSEAQAYLKKYGNLDISSTTNTESGFSLGRWLYSQRLAYDGYAGRKKLTADKIERLQSLGIVLNNQKKDIWREWYERVCEYHKKYGNIDIPATYSDKNGNNVGMWLKEQRKKFKKGNLNGTQIEMLETLGIRWNYVHSDEVWKKHLEEAKQFYRINGHLTAPVGSKLNNWLHALRKNYRRGKMDFKYISQLNEIYPGWIGTDRHY